MTTPAQPDAATPQHTPAHRVHGETCVKVTHREGITSYLHSENDDGPYCVDGLPYCGRCHHYLSESDRTISRLTASLAAETKRADELYRINVEASRELSQTAVDLAQCRKALEDKDALIRRMLYRLDNCVLDIADLRETADWKSTAQDDAFDDSNRDAIAAARSALATGKEGK